VADVIPIGREKNEDAVYFLDNIAIPCSLISSNNRDIRNNELVIQSSLPQISDLNCHYVYLVRLFAFATGQCQRRKALCFPIVPFVHSFVQSRYLVNGL